MQVYIVTIMVVESDDSRNCVAIRTLNYSICDHFQFISSKRKKEVALSLLIIIIVVIVLHSDFHRSSVYELLIGFNINLKTFKDFVFLR